MRRSNHWMIFLVISILTTAVHAAKPGELKLGLGVLPYNMYKTTTNANGNLSPIGEVFYPIVAQGHFNIFGASMISPRVAYTFLPQRTANGATDMTIFMLSLPMTGNFLSEEGTDWKFGVGILRIEQKGKGGTVVLNNGSGTSTFARPNYSSSAQMLTLEAGLGFDISEQMSVGTDLIITSAFTTRRAMSALITFNYTFGNGLGFGGGGSF